MAERPHETLPKGNKKVKGQRAVIIIKDIPEGKISASITFEPSIRGRKEQSPACNAATRLYMILQQYHNDLAKRLTEPGGIILTDA